MITPIIVVNYMGNINTNHHGFQKQIIIKRLKLVETFSLKALMIICITRLIKVNIK